MNKHITHDEGLDAVDNDHQHSRQQPTGDQGPPMLRERNMDIRHQQVLLRWRELGETALGITPTEIPLEPRPSEISAIADDLNVLIRRVDALVEAYGAYVAANSTTAVDQSLFRDQLRAALEGNAIYEIESAADDLRQQIMEAAE